MSKRTAGADEGKTLNYQELRKMVECAASYRDEPVYIVVDESGKWNVHTQDPGNPPDKAVIPVWSPGKLRKPEDSEKKVTCAQITFDGGTPANLLKLPVDGKEEEADAVFWSPAAVEKFVVPYYASVYGDQAPKKLTTLINVLGTVRELDGTPAAPAEIATDVIPFAVAHMPKSEYVPVDDDAGIRVLRLTDKGVEVVSLTEHAKPRPAR